jgi:hypothetical protein
MVALLSLLVVLSVSLTIMRVGAVALAMTGVSREAARFQAQSAFLGVGFTTRESEQMLRHPVRRRIIMVLMLLGNAGVVVAISGVVLVFLTASAPVGWIPRVRSEGALVLSIERPDGSYVGVPCGPSRIRSDDVLIVYGRSALLEELDSRPTGTAGDRAHAEAVAEQDEIEAMERSAGSAGSRAELAAATGRAAAGTSAGGAAGGSRERAAEQQRGGDRWRRQPNAGGAALLPVRPGARLR